MPLFSWEQLSYIWNKGFLLLEKSCRAFSMAIKSHLWEDFLNAFAFAAAFWFWGETSSVRKCLVVLWISKRLLFVFTSLYILLSCCVFVIPSFFSHHAKIFKRADSQAEPGTVWYFHTASVAAGECYDISAAQHCILPPPLKTSIDMSIGLVAPSWNIWDLKWIITVVLSWCDLLFGFLTLSRCLATTIKSLMSRICTRTCNPPAATSRTVLECRHRLYHELCHKLSHELLYIMICVMIWTLCLYNNWCRELCQDLYTSCLSCCILTCVMSCVMSSVITTLQICDCVFDLEKTQNKRVPLRLQ